MKQNEASHEIVSTPMNQFYEVRIRDVNIGRGRFVVRDTSDHPLIHTAPCIHILNILYFIVLQHVAKWLHLDIYPFLIIMIERSKMSNMKYMG